MYADYEKMSMAIYSSIFPVIFEYICDGGNLFHDWWFFEERDSRTNLAGIIFLQ